MSKRFIYWLLAFLIILLLMEGFVRVFFKLKGYKTEHFAPYWESFIMVDTLEVEKEFYTNSQGIYVANSNFWIEDDMVSLNAHEFRGREFVKNDSTTVVFNIGDSFAWGADATTYEHCFVSQLETLSGGEITSLNAGIPGTDPAQYELIAEIYMPAVMPDIVAVHLFLGNDLTPTTRKIIPNAPLYYQTNAGWLLGYYKDQYFDSAEESYQFLLKRYLPENTFEKVISKTALGTLIITLPLRIEEYTNWKKSNKSFVANTHLKAIKSISEKNGAQFKLFVIPSPFADLNEDYISNPKDYLLKTYPNAFVDLEDDLYPYPVEAKHFRPAPNSHLNDEGHLIAAKYILENLD